MKEMLERAKTIKSNLIRVVDSTLKINQWNMPLYVGMCHNVHVLKMPTFLMLCSVNNDTM
jgi:hypothetical protein